MLKFNERECEYCKKVMTLKTVTKEGHKNYGKIYAVEQKKRFCGISCQNSWQKDTKWEDIVGKEVAEKIRLEKSIQMSMNNPSKNKEVAHKISKSLKKHLKENPRYGKKNPFYGREHTNEYKENASKSKKGKWSYDINGYIKLLENTPKGEEHPNWNGGSSSFPYPPEFNKALKHQIKKRDKNSCKLCNKNTQKLCIHHIDYNKQNCNENNLISLCTNCHSKTNYNRHVWQKLFENIIKSDYLTDNSNE